MVQAAKDIAPVAKSHTDAMAAYGDEGAKVDVQYFPAVRILNERGDYSASIGVLPPWIRPLLKKFHPWYCKGNASTTKLAGLVVAAVSKYLKALMDRVDVLNKLQAGKDDAGKPMGSPELSLRHSLNSLSARTLQIFTVAPIVVGPHGIGYSLDPASLVTLSFQATERVGIDYVISFLFETTPFSLPLIFLSLRLLAFCSQPWRTDRKDGRGASYISLHLLIVRRPSTKIPSLTAKSLPRPTPQGSSHTWTSSIVPAPHSPTTQESSFSLHSSSSLPLQNRSSHLPSIPQWSP